MEDTPIQMTIAGLVVWLLQFLKNHPRVNISPAFARSVSLFVAACTSVGISFAVEGTLDTGGRLIVTFPALVSILTHFGQSFIYTEVGYTGLQIKQILGTLARLESYRAPVGMAVAKAAEQNGGTGTGGQP